jgi:hypothetical protein
MTAVLSALGLLVLVVACLWIGLRAIGRVMSPHDH